LVVWADLTRSPVMEALAPAVLEEYGIELVVQEVDFQTIRDQVKLAGPAGEGPDIFLGAHDWLGELYGSGIVSAIAIDNEDQFVAPALQAFTFNSELVGMPYATENVALIYNPELVPEPPTTWDEVIAIATELEEAGTVKQGWVMQENDAFHYYPLMTAHGGYVFGLDADGNYDPTDVGLDSEGSLAAATFLDQAVKDGHIVADVDWSTMHALYESGDAAMMITGPWSLSRFNDAGMPYAITTLPAQTADGQPFMGVQGFMINAFSENALLAEAFLNDFVATEETMQAIFDSGDRPSAFIPVIEATDDPEIAAFAAAGVGANPMPAIPEMSAVWGAWNDAITLIFQQAEDPVEAFQNAAEQVRTLIAEGS